MEIREGAYYRSRIGYVQGPLRRSGSTAMPWTCNGWSWDAKGRFATDERLDSYDLVAEVYVSDTPPGERDALKAENEKLRAALKQARRDALEQAAQVADKHAHGSDKKFAEVVRKASAAGNSRIFDLAAASAAGMDHEARKIAAAIRALGEKEAVG